MVAARGKKEMYVCGGGLIRAREETLGGSQTDR